MVRAQGARQACAARVEIATFGHTFVERPPEETLEAAYVASFLRRRP